MTLEQEVEIMRYETELARVTAAKQEMNLKVKERELDIKRLGDNIVIQDKRIAEIYKILSNLKGE